MKELEVLDARTVAPDLVEELRAARARVNEAARDAAQKCGAAVRLAAECGKVLIRIRDTLRESKTFVAFLEEHWPDGGKSTAYKWIRLAESPEEIWKDAASLRQAYIAVGLLPEPAPALREENEAGKPAWNYLVHLGRAERALQRQLADIPKLAAAERKLLKERIEPWVKIYQTL